MPRVTSGIRRALRWLLDSARRPDVQTDALQIVKTAIAVMAAWWLTAQLFSLPSSFLAPWAALMTVHATVYRSFSRGIQSVVATGVGIVVAFVVVQAVGSGLPSLGLAILLALALARIGFLPQEGVTIATSALFVLTLGITTAETTLLVRLGDTAIGVACGIAVNLVLVPPLTHRSAEQQLDRLDIAMGRLMVQMAEQMREPWTREASRVWIERTRQMDGQLTRAWELVSHARESGFWNPRRRWSTAAGDAETYERILVRIEDGIAHLRALARTADQSARTGTSWDPAFRDAWVELLAETGRRIADPDADVREMRERVEALIGSLSHEELPGLLWPLYGTLISDLLNIIDIVDDVSTSRRARR